MFWFLIRFNFLSLMFIIYFLFNVTKAIGSDFSFEFSIYTALKNSLELKAQRYRLASVKHSLGETSSSKDWSSSFTTVLNSSNK